MDSMSLFTNALNTGTKWYDTLTSILTFGIANLVKNFQQKKALNNLQAFFNTIIIPLMDTTKNINQSQ
jgi:hypothetical protein